MLVEILQQSFHMTRQLLAYLHYSVEEFLFGFLNNVDLIFCQILVEAFRKIPKASWSAKERYSCPFLCYAFLHPQSSFSFQISLGKQQNCCYAIRHPPPTHPPLFQSQASQGRQKKSLFLINTEKEEIQEFIV